MQTDPQETNPVVALEQAQRLVDELSAALAANHAELVARAAAIDERLGLSSASSMHRAALCPGSVVLEAQCPPEPPGPDAERGTRIHRWLSHRDVELTPDEMETALACARMLDDVRMRWSLEGAVINMEERLWLCYDLPFPFDQARACSGQPDIVYAQGNRALVIEYKTGFTEPDPAEVNYQLRTQAVLVAENSDGAVDEVTCCIIAPNVSREVSLVTYTSDDLLQAREEILGICERTRDPNAPRIPGESQCRYCRAKLRCPEALALVVAVPDLEPRVPLVSMDGVDLAFYRNACMIARVIDAAVEDEMKRRLTEDPNSVPGWMLADGNKVRHVEDVEGIYGAMEGAINHKGFLSCVEVKVGKLEDLYVANTAGRFPTKKAAHADFRNVVAPYITLKQNAPSLKRIKELPE